MILLSIGTASANGRFTTDNCGILLTFGSYATGPDHETLSAIRHFVENAGDIEAVELKTRGDEGEASLCLHVHAAHLDAVYHQLKALVPAESRQGWTELSRKGKPPFRTQWPK